MLEIIKQLAMDVAESGADFTVGTVVSAEPLTIRLEEGMELTAEFLVQMENTLEWEENRKLNESAYIGWPTSHHTGDNVPVYAIGKGAERFNGKMDNTDFRSKILAE